MIYDLVIVIVTCVTAIMPCYNPNSKSKIANKIKMKMKIRNKNKIN